MKILSLFYKDKKGGFTRRLYSLYLKLAGQGCEIHFLGAERVPVEHDGIIQHIARGPGNEGSGVFFWLGFMIFALFQSLRLASREHIDRIVTFGPFYTALCILPVLFKGVPAVTFVRADNMKHSRNSIRNVFFFVADWLGLLLSSRVVFVSNTLMEAYRRRYRIPCSRCCVLPNGSSGRFEFPSHEKKRIRESLGLKNGEFLMSSSGIFNDGKNFSFLIGVLAELAGHGMKLVLIGDDVNASGERKRLERQAEGLGITPKVIFTGWQEDPRPIIASSDLFIFPSKFEGSPNALIEALSCGVPCLGSDIDEIREVLLHEDLLFGLSRTEALVGKVLDIKKNPDTRKHLTDLSRKRFDRFSFNWAEQAAGIVKDDVLP